MAEADRSFASATAGPPGRLLLRGAVARLAQVPPSTAFALRFAIAVSAAIWIGHLPGLATNEPQWILITVLVVLQPMAGGSLLKGLTRAAGTAVAAVTAILLFGTFSQDPPWLLASLFLVNAVAAYGFTGPRYPYAWFVWAFTTSVVLGGALSGKTEVETLAFQRASMVGIGLLIAFVVDAVFWPSRSEEGLRRSLAGRARALGASLRHDIEGMLGAREPGVGDGGPPTSPLTSQLGMAGAAQAELGVSRVRIETLTRVALLLEGLASRERTLRQALAEGALPVSAAPGLAAALADLGRCVEASLAEAAQALGADRAPAPLASELAAALARLEAELARDSSGGARVERRIAELRDLVGLLRNLEESLAGLAPATTGRDAPSAGASHPTRVSFRLDPFRVQIALRVAIAVCAAVLGVLVLGWDMNTLVAPIAFMVAGTPTRGATMQTVVLLTAVLLFGWLLADLSIVFVVPHLGRIPLALVLPFALAGGLAWLSTKRPALAILPSIGGLLAILPVFGGMTAPTDVYAPYSTTCYFALAIGVGFAATQLLWPATAATLFRERAAAQLEICLEAFRHGLDTADPSIRRRRAAQALRAYPRQTAMVAKLHGQARHEPVERALDEGRRSEWIALAQDLFDAVLAARPRPARPTDPRPAALVALHDALDRADEALVRSIEGTADALRGSAAGPPTALAGARDLVEARVEEVRDEVAAGWTPGAEERASVLHRIESLRRLCARQLAIEAWWIGWLRACPAP